MNQKNAGGQTESGQVIDAQRKTGADTEAIKAQRKTGADTEAMLHEIALIRQAVNRSQSLMRRIPFISGLRPVLLLTGLLLLFFCGGKYLLEMFYGDTAPAYLHVLLNGLLIAGGVVVIFMKINGMLRLARQDDASIDFSGLIRELYNRPFTLLAGTAGFLAVGLPVWLSYIGQSLLILPVFGMVMGIMMMGIVAIFDMREMIIGAVWLIVCGYALLWLIGSMNLWLAMALEFSIPMLLMWAFTKRSDMRVDKKGGRT